MIGINTLLSAISSASKAAPKNGSSQSGLDKKLKDFGTGIGQSAGQKSSNTGRSRSRSREDEIFDALISGSQPKGISLDTEPSQSRQEQLQSREEAVYAALQQQQEAAAKEAEAAEKVNTANAQRDKLIGDLRALRSSSGFVTDELSRANYEQAEQRILADLAAQDEVLGKGPQDYSDGALAEIAKQQNAARTWQEKQAQREKDAKAAEDAKAVLDYYDTVFTQRQFWTADDYAKYNRAKRQAAYQGPTGNSNAEREYLLQQAQEVREKYERMGDTNAAYLMFGLGEEQDKTVARDAELAPIYARLRELDTELGNDPQDYESYALTPAERASKVVESSARDQASGYANAAATLLDFENSRRNRDDVLGQALAGSDYTAVAGNDAAQQFLASMPQDNQAYYAARPETIAQMQAYADEQAARAAMATQEAKRDLGAFGQTAVDVGKGLMDVGADTAASLAAPGAGMFAMGARVFGTAAQEARLDGKDVDEQMLQGIKAAAIEMATEKIGGPFEKAYGGTLLGKATSEAVEKLGANSAFRKFLLKEGANFLTEGGEEIASNFLDTFLSRMRTRISNEVHGENEALEAYNIPEMLYEGLVGGLTGLVGGTQVAMNEAQMEAYVDGVITALEERLAAGEMPNTAQAAQGAQNAIQSEGDTQTPQEGLESATWLSEQFNPELAQTLQQDRENINNMLNEGEQFANEQQAEADMDAVVALMGSKTFTDAKKIIDNAAYRRVYEALTGETLPESRNRAAQQVINRARSDDPLPNLGNVDVIDIILGGTGRPAAVAQAPAQVQAEAPPPTAEQAAPEVQQPANIIPPAPAPAMPVPLAEQTQATPAEQMPAPAEQTPAENRPTWDEKADAQKHADRLYEQANDAQEQAEKYRKLALAAEDPGTAEAYNNAADALIEKAQRLRSEAAQTEQEMFERGEPEKAITSQVEARGREREAGFNENIRTDENRPEALREIVEKDPEMYRQLSNKDTLAAAQDIFTKGHAEAMRTLEAALDAAEAGRKLAPEMVPLAKLLSDELTIRGDTYKAQEIVQRVSRQLIEAGQLGQAARILRKSVGDIITEQAYKALEGQDEQTRIDFAEKMGALAEQYKNALGDHRQGDPFTEAQIADLRQLIKDLSDMRNTGTLFKANFGKILDKISDGDYLNEFVQKQMLSVIDDAAAKPTDNIGDKVKTVQVLSQLMSLATIERNLVGNLSFGAVDLFQANTFGFAIDKLVSKFTGKKTVGVESGWFNSDSRQAATDAMMKSVLEVAADVNMDTQSNKYNLSANRAFKMSGGVFSQVVSRMEQILGYGLQSSDKLFRGKTEAGTARALENLKNSNLTAEEIAEIAKQDADYRLFQNEGVAAKASQGVHDLLNLFGFGGQVQGSQRKGGFGLGDLVNTYPKVPANLGVKLLEYSPLDFAKGLGQLVINGQKGTLTAAKQHEAVLNMSRGLSGTVIMAAFAAIAKSGALRDFDDEDDYDIIAQNKAEGKKGLQWNITATLEGRPNKWRDGDVLVSAAFMEPIDGFLRAGVMIANEDDANIATVTNDILQAAYESVLDLPVLSNISNIEDTIRYSTADTVSGKAIDALSTFAGDSASGFIPAAVRHAANATDEYARDTASNSKPQAALNRVLSNIPGLRETLPVKTDAFGQNVSNGPAWQRAANVALPGRLDTLSQSKESAAIEALIEATGKKSLMPARKGPKTVEIGGTDVKLTDGQSRAFKTKLGNAYADGISALLESGAWDKMPTDVQAKVATDLKAMANAAATSQVAKTKGLEYETTWADELKLKNPAAYIAVKDTYSLATKGDRVDYKAIDALLKASGMYTKLDSRSKELLENSASYLDELSEAAGYGINAKAWYAAKNKQQELNKAELTATQRAAEFSFWLDGQPYSKEQRDLLQEQMGFYTSNRADSDVYDALHASGLTPDKAKTAYDTIRGLPVLDGHAGVTKAQIYKSIADMDLSDAEKWKVFDQYATDAAKRAAGRYESYDDFASSNSKYVRIK